ncbi:MAG: MerR family transcriptional regulator [Lysobacterales bacterium]
MTQFRIGELAKAAGVNVETIRFYQRRGILPLPVRPPGGIRRYSGQHLKLLQLIVRAREIGYSLIEIVDAFSRLEQPCAVTQQYALRKLARVEAKIDSLKELSGRLQAWNEFCLDNPCRTVLEAIEATVGPLNQKTLGELRTRRQVSRPRDPTD